MSDEPVPGFGLLTCVLCGEQATISVDLDDVFTFHCPECSGDFDLEDVAKVINGWQAVIDWLDTCPKLRTP